MTQPPVWYSVGWKSQFLQHATNGDLAHLNRGEGMQLCVKVLVYDFVNKCCKRM